MGPVDQEISRSSSRASKPALRLLASVALALHLAAHAGRGQELEPRALTNVPVGTDFVALGYGYAQGNIFLDPAIPVEDLDSKLQTFVGARARAIDFFGLSSKLDLMVPRPFAAGDWEGVLEGVGAPALGPVATKSPRSDRWFWTGHPRVGAMSLSLQPTGSLAHRDRDFESLAPPAAFSTGLGSVGSLAFGYTLETNGILSPTYRSQFWRGWALITSVEVSLLALTLMAPQDWTGWEDDFIRDGLDNLREAWTSPPLMDDDIWFHNYLGHPYGGNVYYNTVRSQGATSAQSFFFSAFMSAQWEYVFEAVAERPSIQDLIITPVAGSILGELVHRATLAMKKNGTSLPEKAFILLFNPTHVVMKGFD